jgi:hypothetical protein
LILFAVPLDRVRSLEELSPHPLVYERSAFMEHIRRYDREALRTYYACQPVDGAQVWANYVVNLWEYEHGVEEVTSYPWNITIPMTEVCNATCTFCSSPLVPNPKALAVPEIRHFGGVLRHALRVSLQGLGEPLAHPHFEEIAEEIKKYLSPVAQVEIITNGWLLTGRRWEVLKSLRVCDIQVSVNAATDRTHQVAMGSRAGTFDQVVKNIEHVLTDREWPWPSFLKVSMVVTRHSLPEIPQFLELFVRKGVQRFQFNALLPLTNLDWGFGRAGQYLDLWCGHLANAVELVEKATAAIARYRRKGIIITATPDQWLLPVHPSLGAEQMRLSTDQQSTAVFQVGSGQKSYKREWDSLCVRVDAQRVPLAPHEEHTDVIGAERDGVRFRGTPQSCPWAYILRTHRLPLRAGEYRLELEVQIDSGRLYGGILDTEKDTFVVQEELLSGNTCIEFALPDERLIDVVVRQGTDDTPISAVYWNGRLTALGDRNEPTVQESAEKHVEQTPTSLEGPQAMDTSSPISATRGTFRPPLSLAKPFRIYCPMVYSTLSIFHHSLDVSICCYMETAPGERQPNLKDMAALQAYNDNGFKLVRRTLNTDHHIPVCDRCPYGAARA